MKSVYIIFWFTYAFVHNDFTGEVPPKFEIFPNRLEITSAGGLPVGLTQEEFFEGFSVPRNKELMRIFKDLDMVEQLGSGVPRILKHYSRDCFTFTDNFLRMSFPIASGYITPQVTLQVIPQVTPQVLGLISIINGELSRSQLQEQLELSDRRNFNDHYLKPALKHKIIEMTIPEKPNSSKQKYRLTDLGLRLKKQEEK